MAKYKHYDYSQGKFIPINFDKQILHGTFEHTLHYLIDNDLDLSAFELCYKNDETGAPAYDPRILLKIVLYAYSTNLGDVVTMLDFLLTGIPFYCRIPPCQDKPALMRPVHCTTS